MKRVGLMTCYMNNFGACLQAYALQTVIKQEGNDCEIIQYTPVRALKKYPFPIKIALYVRNEIKGLKSEICSYENARSRSFYKFRRHFLSFGTKVYNKIPQLYKDIPNYDCFVTGSDQLWNPLIHGETNNKAYFLDFVPDEKKKIAYSPSIGIKQIPDNCKEEFIRLVKKIDVLSVREASGQKIIKELSGRECRIVLDPTLLLTKKEWLSIAAKPLYERPYIFCYLFSEREYIGKFIEHVKKCLSLDIVVIPFTKREFESDCIKIKNAGPQEFISLIANATLVITDSFHATAFSINMNVPFYSLMRNAENERNNMNSRIDNILTITGLEDRKITCYEDFPASIDLSINFLAANKTINERRASDLKFLREAIDSSK